MRNRDTSPEQIAPDKHPSGNTLPLRIISRQRVSTGVGLHALFELFAIRFPDLKCSRVL